jgi:hypothetical protein
VTSAPGQPPGAAFEDALAEGASPAVAARPVGWVDATSPPAVAEPPDAVDQVSPAAPPPAGRRPAPGPARTSPAARPSGPRRARLVVRTVDPWSVLKVSLIYSLCLLVVGVVAVAILYAVLSGLGVFDSLSKFLDTVTDSGPGTTSGSARSSFGPLAVIGGSAVVLAVNALLITALATLGAFLYNLCSSFVGGIEVTLSERE